MAAAGTTTKRKARKRAEGEGTIYQRGDGLWIGEIMVGRKPDGRRDVRRVSAKTQAKCRTTLNKTRQAYEGGTLGERDKSKETLAGYLDIWLEAARLNLRATTWLRYRQFIQLHIVPALGKKSLTDVRPDDVQRLYATKGKEGLAPRTTRQMHAVLHRAFGQALRWGYVPRNIVDAVDAPTFARFELTPPSNEELIRLLDTAAEAEDPLRTLWTVVVYSGCRQGELLGLRWPDVDVDGVTLFVRHTLIGVDGGKPRFGDPDTANSRRKVSLPEEAVRELRAHRQRQLGQRLALGPDYADFGLVFAQPTGLPLPARKVVRVFKAALRRAGLRESIRFHDLRHAHATLMLRSGVHPKSASARLGHGSIAITMDLYTDAVPGLDADAADRVEEALRG